MEIIYEKTLKSSHDLEVGDNLLVGDLMCEIKDARKCIADEHIELTLQVSGATPKVGKIYMTLPNKLPIEVLK